MKLAELLNGWAHVSDDITIDGLALDSRKVQAGDAFIALHGALQHGINHARRAIENGARAVIYDPAGLDTLEVYSVTAVAVPNLGEHLGKLAARFYGQPAQQLEVIGITGTNGKTTCSQLIAQALPECGVIGTLGWGEPGQLQPTVNTTPDALALQQILQQFVQLHKRRVAMEVSSHGLQQGRVNGIAFKGAVFTNLSRDHLDYHGNMDAYLQAKLSLFATPGLQFAVLNLDDANSAAVLQRLADNVICWGFSTSGWRADDVECVVADQIVYSAEGIRFQVRWNEQVAGASTSLVGAFNLQNLLTVLCVLLAMGWQFDQAVAQLASLTAVTGRLEKFGGQGKPRVFVDYAHTPDALEKVLQSSKNNGKLWVVFGCGGDRDAGKRPEMGRIAETWADQVVVTDDNPRSETPETIINAILTGCQTDKVSIIHDRKTAITTVIQQAAADDCIVIAGKGHENYQEINGIKQPFSDQDVVIAALAAWSRA